MVELQSSHSLSLLIEVGLYKWSIQPFKGSGLTLCSQEVNPGSDLALAVLGNLKPQGFTGRTLCGRTLCGSGHFVGEEMVTTLGILDDAMFTSKSHHTQRVKD